MHFSPRELLLLVVTMGAILFGMTYWLGKGRWDAYMKQRSQRSNIEQRIIKNEYRLSKKARLDEELGELQSTVPKYPAAQSITSLQLKQIQLIAEKSKITLSNRKPDEPTQVGDLNLYELAISCSWQGGLEPLTYFLYNLQAQGAALDIRHMTITPESRKPGMLKGTFIVDCAYSKQ